MTTQWLNQAQLTQQESYTNIPVALPVGFINDISQADSISSTLNALARWLPSIIEADRASIALAVDERQLRLFAIQGDQALPVGKLLPIDQTMIGEVYQSKSLKIAHDLAEMPGIDCQILRDAGLNTCLDAPLISGEECYGTLNLAHQKRQFYNEQQMVILQCLAKWVASHIRIHKQIQNISTLAMTDPLTQVLNRRAFLEAAEQQFNQWHNNGTPFALAILDLDHFKKINDQYGHAGGDKALTEFANQLKALVRKNDCVARFGGEEFVILLQDMGKNSALRWAQNFIQAIYDLNTEFGSQIIKFTVSIGIAIPNFGDKSIEAILNRADAALYESKNSGRNRASATE